MRCGVHSPGGTYFIRFVFDESGIHLSACEKHNDNISDPTSTPTIFAADLNADEVETLTNNAGVVKDIHLFSRMIHAALTGTSQCLTFDVITVEDVTRRIRHRQQQQQQHGDLPSDDVPLAATHDPEMANHRVFLLEYTVDFTTAMFPIPMRKTTFSDVFGRQQGSSSSRLSSPPGIVSAVHAASTPQESLWKDSSTELVAVKHTPATIPKVVMTEDDVANATIEKLQSEVKYLRQQNAALRRASEQTLHQMQAECKELKREFGRIEGLQREVNFYKEESRKARAKCSELESVIRKLRASSSAASSSRVAPSPNSRPNRFATPPFRSSSQQGRRPWNSSAGSSRGSNASSTPPRRVPSPGRMMDRSWTPTRSSRPSSHNVPAPAVRSPRRLTPTKYSADRYELQYNVRGPFPRDVRTAAFR